LSQHSFNGFIVFARTAGPANAQTLGKAKALRRALLAHILAHIRIIASYGPAVP
jgi:hypothetical protein